MTEDAKEHAHQAEANPSQAPEPPKFEPDPKLMEESMRHEPRRLVIRPKDSE